MADPKPPRAPLSFLAACLVLAQRRRRNRTSPPSVKLTLVVVDATQESVGKRSRDYQELRDDKAKLLHPFPLRAGH
jgi:hypothetical protein